MLAVAHRLLSPLAVGGLAAFVALATAPRSAPADGIMLVRAGAFWMGRDDGAPDEAPLHRVYVHDFWLERDKVTNAEFAAFLEARGARWAIDPGAATHAVVGVSWFAARDFCAARGRRLPTEAEWEKAARGEDGRAWGVQGLLADPGEWTSTALKPYPYRPDDGREPWSLSGRVVVRGAGADEGAAAPAPTRRLSYDRRGAAVGHPHVGFRCATSEDLGEVAPGRR